MSTADHSPTVRRARELFSLQKWPHADHDLRIMWEHSDLDYDDGLVLFSIARQDYDLGSGLLSRPRENIHLVTAARPVKVVLHGGGTASESVAGLSLLGSAVPAITSSSSSTI
jgi:hypothetical protein